MRVGAAIPRLEASAGGRGGRAQRCDQRRCAGRRVLPDRAQRGRSALPGLRAGGARAVVEGSGGAHRRAGLRARRSCRAITSSTARSPISTGRVAREPRNGRALLVRATVLTVQGKYAEARADCPKLFGLAPEFYVVRLHGRDRQPHRQGGARRRRRSIACWRRCRQATASRAPGASRCWAKSRSAAATRRREAHFRAALAADPRDLYTLGAYADWLLDNGARRGRDSARARTKRASTRCCCGWRSRKRRCGDRKPHASIATLRARFDASRARGDTVHRREEARFALQLERRCGRPRCGWPVTTGTCSANRRTCASSPTPPRPPEIRPRKETVRQWIAQTGLEYPAVATLVDPGGSGRK